MSKILAIKGDKERGKEVIALLEMLGGDNRWKASGNIEKVYYSISNGVILYCTQLEKSAVVFTLDEFYKKYPYKVGDKVRDDYGDALTIKSMWWHDELETMVYDFEDSDIVLTLECLLKYNNPIHKRTHEDVIFDSIIWHLRNSINNGKQNLSGGECEDYFREVIKKNNENKMKNVLAELLEHIKITPKEELEREFEEIEEWTNVGPTVEEFMTFCECVNKKPKYPDNYKECAKIMNCPIDGPSGWLFKFDANIKNTYYRKKDILMGKFIRLLICRDAYWKIAGEEMGLDKPWEPNWTTFEGMPAIFRFRYNIVCDSIKNQHCLLVFPTEEMRDAFYENFKDLIEECKDLL